MGNFANMKSNSNTKIVGSKVVLVPYKTWHVARYNEWLQREDLRKVTGSEQLSLEDHYKWQKACLENDNVCLFIILDKELLELKEEEKSCECMIGDTHLYLSKDDGNVTAECGIMIAEESARGCKKGLESLLMMMKYGCDQLYVKKYIAKISTSNLPSISLFEKIGFKFESKCDVFSELTLVQDVDDAWKSNLDKFLHFYEITDYSLTVEEDERENEIR